MSKEVKIALIGGICVIIAAIIGVFSININVENNKLKGDYEELQSKNLELITQQEVLQDTYDSFQNKYDDLDKNFTSLQNKFEALEKDYNILLQNDDTTKDYETISEKDQIEIDEILENLYLYQNDENAENFRNLLIDANELELFYKIYISIGYYKYSNIIIAFNEYGIDCEGLLINEGTLELWDIENLYLYNQLEKDIENSEEKVYYLENYKMHSIDTCDYKRYRLKYENETYDEISNDINERINGFTRKMKRNSLLVS